MIILVNPTYPNRVQMQLASLAGPLVSQSLGGFDPRRDLVIYADGLRVPILSFSFDPANNQYLMFTSVPVASASIVQLIHTMPRSPFLSIAQVLLPGFCLVASVSLVSDVVAPAVGVEAVNPIVLGQSVPLIWTARGVAYFRITLSAGGFDSGFVAVTESAGIIYAPSIGSTGTFSAAITGYDTTQQIVLVSGVTLTASTPVVITAT